MSFQLFSGIPLPFSKNVNYSSTEQNKIFLQESETKIHLEGFSRKLTDDEKNRLDKILDKEVQIVPKISNVIPITFTNRELLDFLNYQLYKKGLIAEPCCDIGGGSTRNVLDKTWEYSDVDVSYHLLIPDDDAIMEIAIKFVLMKLKKAGVYIDFSNQNLFRWVSDCYLFNKEKITYGPKLVQRFIGLGEKGIDLKFIADKNARWNVASYDSFYISYPKNEVRCVNVGNYCNKAEFDNNLKHLNNRSWVSQRANEVSGLIFCIVHAQSQGVDVPNEDQYTALKQFGEKYSLYSPTSQSRLIQKFDRFLRNHSTNDFRSLSILFNFLSLILKNETQEERHFYINNLAKAWNLRSCEKIGDSPLNFQNFVQLLQEDPSCTESLIDLVLGLFFYEFVRKKTDPNELSCNAHVNAFSSSWKLSITHKNKTSHLHTFQKTPVEFARAFLNAWTSMERFGNQVTYLFKDFGFSNLDFSEESKGKVMREIMDSFDQPPLSHLLSETFPKTNPNAFYASVKHAFPNLIDSRYLEKKFLLGHLWQDLMESKKTNDAEAVKFIAQIRRFIQHSDLEIGLDDLTPLTKFLESCLSLQTSKHLKKTLANCIHYFIHLIGLQTQSLPALINEGFKLATLYESKELNPLENKNNLISTLLNDCLKISGKDPIEIMNLLILLNEVRKNGSHSIQATNAIQHLSLILDQISLNKEVSFQESKFKKMSETLFNALMAAPPESLWQKASLRLFSNLLKYAIEKNSPQFWHELNVTAEKLPNEILSQFKMNSNSEDPVRNQILLGMADSFSSDILSKCQNQYKFFLTLYEKTQKDSSEILTKIYKNMQVNGKLTTSKSAKLFLQVVIKIDSKLAAKILDDFKKKALNKIDSSELASAISTMPQFESIKRLNLLLTEPGTTSQQINDSVTEIIETFNSYNGESIELHFQKVASEILRALKQLILCDANQAERLFDLSQKINLIQADLCNELSLKFALHHASQVPVASEKVLKHLDGFLHYLTSNKISQEQVLDYLNEMTGRLRNHSQLAIKILIHAIQNRFWNDDMQNHCLYVINQFSNVPLASPQNEDLKNLVTALNNSINRGYVFTGNNPGFFIEALLNTKNYKLFLETWHSYPYLSLLSKEEASKILKNMCETKNKDLVEVCFKVFYKESEKLSDLCFPLMNVYKNSLDELNFVQMRNILDTAIKLDSLTPYDKLTLYQDLFTYLAKLIHKDHEQLKSRIQKKKNEKSIIDHNLKGYLNYLIEKCQVLLKLCTDSSTEEKAAKIFSIVIKSLASLDHEEYLLQAQMLYLKLEKRLPGTIFLEIFNGFVRCLHVDSKADRWLPMMATIIDYLENGKITLSDNENDITTIEFVRTLQLMIEKNKIQKSPEYLNRTVDLLKMSLLAKKIPSKIGSLPIIQNVIFSTAEALSNSSMFDDLNALKKLMDKTFSSSENIFYKSEIEKRIHLPNNSSLQALHDRIAKLEIESNEKEFQQVYGLTMTLLPKYKQYNRIFGRNVVSKLIKITLEKAPQLTRIADQLLSEAQKLDFFFKANLLESFLIEIDEKENNESNSIYWDLQFLIAKSACKINHIDIALTRLANLSYLMILQNYETLNKFYDLALEVHDLIILDIITNHQEKAQAVRLQYYILYISEFIMNLIKRNEFLLNRDLKTGFLLEVLSRIIFYPTIFEKTISETNILLLSSLKSKSSPSSIEMYNNFIKKLDYSDTRIPLESAALLLKQLNMDTIKKGFNRTTFSLFDTLPVIMLKGWIDSPDFIKTLDNPITCKKLLHIMQIIYYESFNFYMLSKTEERLSLIVLSTLTHLFQHTWASKSALNFLIPFLRQFIIRMIFYHPLYKALSSVIGINKNPNKLIKEIRSDLDSKTILERQLWINVILAKDDFLKNFLGKVEYSELPMNFIFDTLTDKFNLNIMWQDCSDEQSIVSLVMEIVLKVLNSCHNIDFEPDHAVELNAELNSTFDIINTYIKELPKNLQKKYQARFTEFHKKWLQRHPISLISTEQKSAPLQDVKSKGVKE